MDALDEKAELLAKEMKVLEEAACGFRDDGSMSPNSFQQGTIPYWMCRVSDMLLYHNAVTDSADCQQLPVDSAVLQLRADIAEAKRMLEDVRNGCEGVSFLSRLLPLPHGGTAQESEIYGVAAAGHPSRNNNGDAPTSFEMAVVNSDTREADREEDESGTVVVPMPSTARPGGEDEVAADEEHHSLLADTRPLLTAEEEEKDEQRPLLQRYIPLWRRRSAAQKTLTDLVVFLENRLAALESRLDDPQDGPWFETVGAPNATGANGRQRSTLPPAVEQAFATTMTRTLLSDLFTHTTSAMTHRAERMSAAFIAHTPNIHDHYIIEEDIRPVYDYLLLKHANMLDSGIAGREGEASSDPSRYKSFTVHIDYLRVHPSTFNSGEALGQVCQLFTDGVHAASTFASSTATSDGIRTFTASSRSSSSPESVMLSSTSTPFSIDQIDFRPGSTDMAVLMALSLATGQGNALVPFTPEEYMVATLLLHYERYRLLKLNLLPHLKSRVFYEEQIQHLVRQPNRNADMDHLQERLQVLANRSAEVERHSMNCMIAAWRAVLQLRGGLDQAFVVSHRRQARALSLAAQQSSSAVQFDMDVGSPSLLSGEPRHVTEHADVFDSTADTGDHDDDPLELFPVTPMHTVRALNLAEAVGSPLSLLGGSAETTAGSGPGGNGGSDYGDGSDEGATSSSAPFGRRLAAERFRFYLRRVGQSAEVPYVLGEDVLQYVPVVEGVEAMRPPPPPPPAEAAAASPRSSDASSSDQPQRDALLELDDLQFFQIVVFARSNPAVAPQYVGCTLPRPMTASKTIFFNESFEIRGLREPQEMIMHVINVSGGAGSGSVVATARLQPTLTRCYLLIPLESPIAFVFRGASLPRYPGSGLNGVLSLSTTWTSAEGLTIPQIEHMFMSGVADPMDPQYAPLLRSLKAYYDEIERYKAKAEQHAKSKLNASSSRRQRHTQVDTHESGHARHSSSAGNRRRRAHSTKGGINQSEEEGIIAAIYRASHAASAGGAGAGASGLEPSSPTTGNNAVITPNSLPSERLKLLHRRWCITSRKTKALNQLEAALYLNPIPLTSNEQYELLKRVQREVAAEEAERKKSYGDTNFDESSYKDEPSSTSGLALSPLPKDVKLRLWQERQRHLQLTRNPSRHITDEELLGQVVTIPTMSVKLVLDLKPRSQLNPRRVARQKTEDIDRTSLAERKDSHIVVHVMKAHHLPRRVDGTPLEPFVQVGFVYESVYSRCEVGSSPSWFQSLEVPFQPLNFEEDTLSMIDDDIVVSVYDKVELPMAQTQGAVAHETHYRTERRLLGTVRLPFYSLHQADEAHMEGVYHLQTPRWLMGYELSPADADQNPFDQQAVQNVSGGGSTLSTGPTIQLYISLSPPLQREKAAEMSMSDLTYAVQHLNVSAGLRYLHDVALRWKKSATSKIRSSTSINAQSSDRDVDPFVCCSTGDLVLCCRYLLPHGGPPPATVTNIYEAIRYVSLLPFVVDVMTWGDKDVWSTNVELLTLRSGDYEELALLLTHFLRHLAPEHASYVVIGHGDIYRQTIMVLHAFEGTQWRLIDPRTGWISPVERPFGSVLKDVSVVLSHDQMWANTQLSGLPHRMTWDLNDQRDWMPCFDHTKDRRLKACMPVLLPLQREVLTFQPANTVLAKQLELDLRASLKKALLAWRNQRQPAYHRGVEAILHDLLIAAEEERCACGSVRHPSVTLSARRRLSEYFGEPIDGYDTAAAAREAEEEEKKKQRHRRRHHRRHRSTSQARKGGEREEEEEEAGGETDKEDGAESTKGGVASGAHRGGNRPVVQLVGSPVTATYNPADKQFNQIRQQVFESAVHEVGTDDVSFAIGTYVKSYTGDVCAMWVFLVAISRTSAATTTTRV